MYQMNHPLTGELLNIYADNVPAVEGTILDNAYPVRKQHTIVAREEKYYGTIEEVEDKVVYDPENYNDVIGVIVANPVVKAEDGKIDAESLFELILERPLEEVSEEANKIVFTSEEPEIVEVDEEGNLTANVELGQTYVVCQWPSGVSVRLLVTVGEVSEVKPAEPELGGDVVEPEQPENGGEGETPETPVEPEPEDPSEPEVVVSKIKYALMPLAEHMESVDKITAEDLAGLEYTEYPVEAMDKTKAPIEAEKMVVILVPVASGLKAMKDNGIGTQEAFSEDVFGANGQYTYTLDGTEYALYGEYFIVGGADSDFYIYIV